MVIDRSTLALLIGLGLGALLGIYVARESARRDPVRGGALTKVFHYLGATAFVAGLPSVLTTLILGGGFGGALLAGIGLVVISVLLLFVYALLETPARAALPAEDDAWTKEKAQSSGL